MTTKVIPSYTLGMKTAISVPDELFHRVDARAAALGVSRSQFYATAAARYLDELDGAELTLRINEALERAGGDAEAVGFAAFGAQRLDELTEDDQW